MMVNFRKFSDINESPKVNNKLFAKQTDTGFAVKLLGKDLDHIESAAVILVVNTQDTEKNAFYLKVFLANMFPSDNGVKTTTWAFKQIVDMDANNSLTEQTMISEDKKITVEHLQNLKNDTYYVHIEKAL